MEIIRKPFQGVWNIVRFNWHFYAMAGLFLLMLFVLPKFINRQAGVVILIIATLVIVVLLISLTASFYIYDLSGLYRFDWIENSIEQHPAKILNINAGFDETSEFLYRKYNGTKLTVCDFYDPLKHTEASIKRARTAYPPYPGTLSINTRRLPVESNDIDTIFIVLAAHEIRNREERIGFFQECKRILQPGGEIVVMEHLRDLPNFLVYTIGFFHFHSKATWMDTFRSAGLTVQKEIKHTPFISIFILAKDDSSN